MNHDLTKQILGELWARDAGENYRLYVCPHGMAAEPRMLHNASQGNGSPWFDMLSKAHEECYGVPLVRTRTQAEMEAL